MARFLCSSPARTSKILAFTTRRHERGQPGNRKDRSMISPNGLRSAVRANRRGARREAGVALRRWPDGEMIDAAASKARDNLFIAFQPGPSVSKRDAGWFGKRGLVLRLRGR